MDTNEPFARLERLKDELITFLRIAVKKKSALFLALIAFIVIVVYAYSATSTSESSASISAVLKRGPFIVSVTTTGELQAKNSIDIRGPEGARAAGIWQMKISNLVPEGTVVKKGSFVAELDRSEIMQKLKDSELSVQKFQSQYDQVILDSTLTLSQARDEMVNLRFALEESALPRSNPFTRPPRCRGRQKSILNAQSEVSSNRRRIT